MGTDQEERETVILFFCPFFNLVTLAFAQEATGEKDNWQGAEEACTDWRKELKSGFKRGQSEGKGTERDVEGAD